MHHVFIGENEIDLSNKVIEIDSSSENYNHLVKSLRVEKGEDVLCSVDGFKQAFDYRSIVKDINAEKITLSIEENVDANVIVPNPVANIKLDTENETILIASNAQSNLSEKMQNEIQTEKDKQQLLEEVNNNIEIVRNFPKERLKQVSQLFDEACEKQRKEIEELKIRISGLEKELAVLEISHPQ